MKVRIEFSECEHSGDLDEYVDAVQRCGGRVLEQYIDYSEYETGVIIAEVAGDYKEFYLKLKADNWGCFGSPRKME
jgi:hypothetical protein